MLFLFTETSDPLVKLSDAVCYTALLISWRGADVFGYIVQDRSWMTCCRLLLGEQKRTLAPSPPPQLVPAPSCALYLVLALPMALL